MDSRQGSNANQEAGGPVYSTTARLLHWLTVIFVAILIPVGFYMVYRGDVTKFDAVTNTLYSWHKLGGFILLCLIVLRLLYRLFHGAPPDEPTLLWWHKAGAHLAHWGLYLLLLATPFLGWYGVSLYGARGLPFGMALPEIAAPDKAAAEQVLGFHSWAAIVMLCLISAHVGAAIYHHFLRGDGVLRRMLPGLKARR
ncbi:MAG: cytochrome b [Hyphomicrobiaceae bacterium]